MDPSCFSPSSVLNVTISQLMHIDSVIGNTVVLLTVVWKNALRILTTQDAALPAEATREAVLSRFSSRLLFCRQEIAAELNTAFESLSSPALFKFFAVLFVTFTRRFPTTVALSPSFLPIWSTLVSILDTVPIPLFVYA